MADKKAIERALLEKARELFQIAEPLLPAEGGLISINAWADRQKRYDHVSAAVSIFTKETPESGEDMQDVLICWADPSQAEMEIYRSE